MIFKGWISEKRQKNGTREGDRTLNLQLRRLTLYPIELLARPLFIMAVAAIRRLHAPFLLLARPLECMQKSAPLQSLCGVKTAAALVTCSVCIFLRQYAADINLPDDISFSQLLPVFCVLS